MNISLTTFLDFINSRGTDKPGIVKDTIKQGEYNPNNDLYKDIREMIVSIQKGHKTIDDLLSISKRSKQKRENYPPIILGYIKWSTNKSFEHIRDDKFVYNFEGLHLSINPELIIKIKNRPAVVKLYFKAEPLRKSSAEVLSVLLREAYLSHNSELYNDYDFGVLDVRKGYYHRITATTNAELIMNVLTSEAATWRSNLSFFHQEA